MSLNNLFRKARKAAALKNATLATAVVAGVTGFTMMTKSVNSDGQVMESSSSSASNDAAAAGFATSNPVIKPNSSNNTSRNSDSSLNLEACIKNPSATTCADNNSISQQDWDQFLPPEGIVVRDSRGNVIFKKCRSLTEGAAAAKKEMEPEKARFDKFTTAMNIHAGIPNNYDIDYGNYNSACAVRPTKAAPKEEPCPTYKNYTDLKDYYREQYYLMSNALQQKAQENYECRDTRNSIMAAVDANWKNDPGISDGLKGATPVSLNRGVR